MKYGKSRNTFKCQCQDCRETAYFKLNDFARATRPRCPACGSIRLEVCHDEARARIVAHNDVQRQDRRRRLDEQHWPDSRKWTIPRNPCRANPLPALHLRQGARFRARERLTGRGKCAILTT